MAEAPRRSTRNPKPKSDPDFIYTARQIAEIERQVEESLSTPLSLPTRATPKHAMTSLAQTAQESSPTS